MRKRCSTIVGNLTASFSDFKTALKIIYADFMYSSILDLPVDSLKKVSYFDLEIGSHAFKSVCSHLKKRIYCNHN